MMSRLYPLFFLSIFSFSIFSAYAKDGIECNDCECLNGAIRMRVGFTNIPATVPGVKLLIKNKGRPFARDYEATSKLFRAYNVSDEMKNDAYNAKIVKFAEAVGPDIEMRQMTPTEFLKWRVEDDKPVEILFVSDGEVVFYGLPKFETSNKRSEFSPLEVIRARLFLTTKAKIPTEGIAFSQDAEAEYNNQVFDQTSSNLGSYKFRKHAEQLKFAGYFKSYPTFRQFEDSALRHLADEGNLVIIQNKDSYDLGFEGSDSSATTGWLNNTFKPKIVVYNFKTFLNDGLVTVVDTGGILISHYPSHFGYVLEDKIQGVSYFLFSNLLNY